MCSVVVLPDSTQLHTIGDLRAQGWEVTSDDADGCPDTSCLCPVDVEAVLERAGLVWVDDDWGDYQITTNLMG